MKKEVVKEIVESVNPIDNGFVLEFTSVGTGFVMCATGITKSMKFCFGNSSYEADSFVFYKDGKQLFVEKSGWLTKGVWNSDYKTLRFTKHDKIKRVNSDNLELSLYNMDKYGVFFVSKGKQWGENRATIYVPLEYLENLGYEYIKESDNGELETTIKHYVNVGKDDKTIYIVNGYYEVIRHVENYKKQMLEDLQKCVNGSDLCNFINKWESVKVLNEYK